MGSIIGHRIDCNGGMGSERPAAHAPPGGGGGGRKFVAKSIVLDLIIFFN